MISRPRWTMWAAATAVLWIGWGIFVYLPLRERDGGEEAERTDWASKRHDMLRRISSASEVIAQSELLEQQLDSSAQLLPQPSHLNEYLDELAELGEQCGVRVVDVGPELACMMALAESSDGSLLVIDTLVVQLTANGDFHNVGEWLDAIESQPAFRHWRLGRWDKNAELGEVTFSGLAAFLVAVPKAGQS